MCVSTCKEEKERISEIEKKQREVIDTYKVYSSDQTYAKEIILTEKISLSTLERYAIPTGISLAIPSGYEGQIRPRSGLFLKHGITINFGTIDSDYRGEILILVVNLSKSNFIIERGMRVAQIVFNKFERVNLISKLDLDPTLRGAGGFGSTGIKE